MNGNKRINHNLKAALTIIGVVVFAITVFIVMSLLNVSSYKWMFELAVLIVAVFAVYYILRAGNCKYSYETIDGNLVFIQRMGKGERFVFSLDLKDLRRIMDKDTTEAEISRRDLKGVPHYYMDGEDGQEYGLLYYDRALNCEKILKFKPSAQLIEILSEKAIDNASKM